MLVLHTDHTDDRSDHAVENCLTLGPKTTAISNPDSPGAFGASCDWIVSRSI